MPSFKCPCGKDYTRKDYFDQHIAVCEAYKEDREGSIEIPAEPPIPTPPAKPSPKDGPLNQLDHHFFSESAYLAQDAGEYFLVYCKPAFIAVVLEQTPKACKSRFVAMQQLINRGFILVFEKGEPLPAASKWGGPVAKKGI